MFLLKLLGLANWFREAATGLFRLAGRYPWQAAFIAALCLAGWQWHGKGKAIGERDAARAENASIIKASDDARMAQIALNEQTKAKYEAAAKDADNDHAKELADANGATDRYIRANRVRSQSRPGQTATPAEGAVAGVSEIPTAATDLVAISESDLKICTANSVYAKSAYDYGQALISAGVAE